MKVIIVLAFGFLAGCSALDANGNNVSLEKATIDARPVTGGKYKVTVKGYSSTKPAPTK